MQKTMWLLTIFCAFFLLLSVGNNVSATATFQNQFALFIPSGTSTADTLASKHGFINLGQIGSLDNYYLFEHPRLKRRSAEESVDHTRLLLSEPEVKWAEQMVEKKRAKRDTTEERPLWDQLFAESIETAKTPSRSKRQRNFVDDPML